MNLKPNDPHANDLHIYVDGGLRERLPVPEQISSDVRPYARLLVEGALRAALPDSIVWVL